MIKFFGLPYVVSFDVPKRYVENVSHTGLCIITYIDPYAMMTVLTSLFLMWLLAVLQFCPKSMIIVCQYKQKSGNCQTGHFEQQTRLIVTFSDVNA